MELLELELQLLQDQETIGFLRNATLPLLTLDYTYNVNGLGPTRDDSYDLLLEKRFEDHRVGVRLVVPLGNRQAKSRLRQARLRRRQRLATRAAREQLIRSEVFGAVDAAEAAWQRILASRQRSLLAGRRLEAEERQFQLGMGTSTDVLEAQTALSEAQSAEIRALTEYQIALVDSAYATGFILGAARIRWSEYVSEDATGD